MASRSIRRRQRGEVALRPRDDEAEFAVEERRCIERRRRKRDGVDRLPANRRHVEGCGAHSASRLVIRNDQLRRHRADRSRRTRRIGRTGCPFWQLILGAREGAQIGSMPLVACAPDHLWHHYRLDTSRCSCTDASRHVSYTLTMRPKRRARLASGSR